MARRRTRDELLNIILSERVRLCTDNRRGSACWLWKEGQWNSGNGYGKVNFEGKPMMVHRFVWESLMGSIPAGLILDHLCVRRGCCNPAHLELVTIKINTHRDDAVLF